MSQFIFGAIIGAAAAMTALYVIMASAEKEVGTPGQLWEKVMKDRAINKAALQVLGEHRGELTRQQFKTIKGQILAGESEAAMKGLRRILDEKER